MLNDLYKLQSQGYIDLKKHPTDDLYLANYKPDVQYKNLWDEHKLLPLCRGLIIDGNSNIVALPFRKFFNVGEQHNLEDLVDLGQPEITEKLDGSLCILYKDSSGYRFATRGSFVSDQAIAATKLWKELESSLQENLFPEFTYLFEYIGPDNRIVVRYPRNEIRLIGITDKRTGLELSYDAMRLEALDVGLPYVTSYKFDVNNLPTVENAEGYVLFYPKYQLRLKTKFEDYVKLHRVLTGLTPKKVWEYLSTNSADKLIEAIGDEDFQWVKKEISRLQIEYQSLEILCQASIRLVPENDGTRETRKIVAQKFRESQLPLSILFAMYDNRDYTNLIWKELE